jgi:hypothetical protein
MALLALIEARFNDELRASTTHHERPANHLFEDEHIHFEARVPQNLHKHELGAPAPDIVRSERMAQGVNRQWWWFKTEPLAA